MDFAAGLSEDAVGNPTEAADNIVIQYRWTGTSGADVFYGSSLVDTLTGGSGDDTLFGDGGSDTITLGNGSDVVVFDSLSGSDTITDYAVADDSIQLDSATYTSLAPMAPGPLSALSFVSGAGATALDADDYIVYDTSTGGLFYDADGSGVGAAVLIGTLTGAPALTLAEFTVI
jgi:Ca2+-binding RTX toxin-like protein